MILVIDNYDSFTYNIVQYLGYLGAELCVVRNDQLSPRDIRAMQPSHIVISPGPGDPDDSGVSMDVLRARARRLRADTGLNLAPSLSRIEQAGYCTGGSLVI